MSQALKHKYCKIPLTYMKYLKIVKLIEVENSTEAWKRRNEKLFMCIKSQLQ
jgi:hypothetical protein